MTLSRGDSRSARQLLARRAEAWVGRVLEERGYTILERNLRVPGVGELDIIAERDGLTCFVEVRARQSERFGLPEETVGPAKQRQVVRLAALYLSRRGTVGPCRFDVAGVVWDGTEAQKPRLRYYEGAFEASDPAFPAFD